MSPTAAGGDKLKKEKKHGLFGKKKDREEDRGPAAWIAGHPQKLPYDADSLVNGRPLQELWDNADGNCFVYLHPRSSGRGASFKIDSAVFASSPILSRLAFGDSQSNHTVAGAGDRRQMLQADTLSNSSRDSRGSYSNLSDVAQDAHLYLPIRLPSNDPAHPAHQPVVKGAKAEKFDLEAEDLQTLVDIRNFFAFLCGQSLVATVRKSSFFHIFMSIAGILKTYEFSNIDASTHGEVANASFGNYVEELALADVRTSREKTIESIVLGERMKSVLLYNEAFTHGAGKHEDLVALRSPKFALISPTTQNRLVRAAMDLDKRTASIRLILTDFDFPALFSGIWSSRTSDEHKAGVRFDQWKDAFLGTRKWMLSLLSHRYGHWPPKAKSKKNDLETSGLNRLVLTDLYHDLSSLYDLLVNRTNLTTRTVDGVDLQSRAKEEPTVRALRSVLSEYDRSSPPVKPPVPFDLPKLPNLRSTRPNFGSGMDKKADMKALQKKIKDDEIAHILRESWNEDAVVTPFVDAFREMERRAAHGCTMAELVDLRIGQWIFLYVVLQALPMLACDAPGIKWTQAVEYFLCEPPRNGLPWANAGAAAPGASARRTWFSVGEGGSVVSLPSDVVEHGVEGIYRRSHCWQMAEKWSATNPIMQSALHEQEQINASQSAALGEGLPPPPLPSQPGMMRPTSRSGSPAPGMRNPYRNSSIGTGLEALPLPAGVTPDGRPASSITGERPRSSHAVDASKTFDAILADVGTQGKKGRKK